MPPTPNKAEVSKQKRKEAKQKKLLFLLVPLLLVIAFIQVPKLMKSGGGSSTAAATTGAADTAPASTDAASADTSGGAPASTAPAAPVLPTGPVQLVDSDLPPAADPGQLQTFDRFVGKDPFQQQVKPPTGDQPGSGTTPPADTGTTSPADTGPTTTEVLPNAAELVVNGVLESVKIGAGFPASDPTFRLVSIDGKAKTIRIGLVRGSFSTGVPTIELEVGKKLTLVSQPDGIRYELELKDLTTTSGDSTTTPASATPADTTTPADPSATTTAGQ